MARGIDVEQLEHVVNFDVPHVPEDYIHRVGRTARADATGDAFTFVSPEEEQDLAAIERAVGKRLPRVILPDFDYATKPKQRFEVPIAERIAEIRARKADERKRAKEKQARKAANVAGQASGVKRPAASDAGRRNGGSAKASSDETRAGRPRRRSRRRGGTAGGKGEDSAPEAVRARIDRHYRAVWTRHDDVLHQLSHNPLKPSQLRWRSQFYRVLLNRRFAGSCGS